MTKVAYCNTCDQVLSDLREFSKHRGHDTEFKERDA